MASTDPFDSDGSKTFADYEAASIDWQSSDTISTVIRHIADTKLWEKEKPFCLNLPLPEGQPKTNFIGSNHADTPICNLRGREDQFKLDVHGFAFTKLPKFTASFDDTTDIETNYVREMEEFLEKELQADEVFVFDYTRRRRQPFGSDYTGKFYRPPGTVAHVDQTPGAALRRLQLHFGESGERWMEGRMQLINVWRPTFGPLEDCPMAVCDSRTLQDDELIASDLVYPHYIGEKYDLKWSSRHNWYYLKGMMDDECLLIKNFDTAMDGRARFCAHCAIIDPTTPDDARPRESIEVRAMVFHHDYGVIN